MASLICRGDIVGRPDDPAGTIQMMRLQWLFPPVCRRWIGNLRPLPHDDRREILWLVIAVAEMISVWGMCAFGIWLGERHWAWRLARGTGAPSWSILGFRWQPCDNLRSQVIAYLSDTYVGCYRELAHTRYVVHQGPCGTPP
jgi:hypothetical protein